MHLGSLFNHTEAGIGKTEYLIGSASIILLFSILCIRKRKEN